MAQVVAPAFVADTPLVSGITVTVGGIPVPVHRSGRLHLGSVCAEGTCEVVVTCEQPYGTVLVRPEHDGVTVQGDGHTVRFAVDRPRHLYLDFSGRPPLALAIRPLETWQ